MDNPLTHPSACECSLGKPDLHLERTRPPLHPLWLSSRDRGLAKQPGWRWDHVRYQAAVLVQSDHPARTAGVEAGEGSHRDWTGILRLHQKIFCGLGACSCELCYLLSGARETIDEGEGQLSADDQRPRNVRHWVESRQASIHQIECSKHKIGVFCDADLWKNTRFVSKVVKGSGCSGARKVYSRQWRDAGLCPECHDSLAGMKLEAHLLGDNLLRALGGIAHEFSPLELGLELAVY